MYKRTIPLPLLCACCVVAAAQERGVAGTAAGAGAGGGTGGRVALVIGNSKYAGAPLRNPVNDAQAVGKALTGLGFTVEVKTDCTLEAMEMAVMSFGEKIRGAEAAMFYYAGHGVQVNGENYLVPVDADIRAENEVRFRCLNAGLIPAKMETAGARVNIMVLDACRNNPFARSYRSQSAGLAPMQAGQGTLVAFSTGPGQVAADGDGANSLYTSSLLRQLPTPGIKVEDVFKRVRSEILEKTGKAQVPWENTSLIGDFYFIPVNITISPNTAPATAPPAPLAMSGNLQINVNAPNARVKVDGKDAGAASLNVPLDMPDLPAGKVQVEVTAEGYEPLTKVVDIKRGDWTQEAFELAKVITVPASSEVNVVEGTERKTGKKMSVQLLPAEKVTEEHREELPARVREVQGILFPVCRGDFDRDGIQDYAFITLSDNRRWTLRVRTSGSDDLDLTIVEDTDESVGDLSVCDLEGDGQYEYMMSVGYRYPGGAVVDKVAAAWTLFRVTPARTEGDLDGNGIVELSGGYRFMGTEGCNADHVFIDGLYNWTGTECVEVTQEFWNYYEKEIKRFEQAAKKEAEAGTASPEHLRNFYTAANEVRKFFGK